jgi:hypothetical protein
MCKVRAMVSGRPKPTLHALGSAYYAGCLEVSRFVGEFVVPTVERETAIVTGGRTFRHPFYAKLACWAMTSRLHAWLLTLHKLGGPSDFQAVATAGRALFEMAVDLTLIKFEEDGSFGKMQAWHLDTKVRWARQRIDNGIDKDGSASKFVAAEGPRVAEMLSKHWGTPELRKQRRRDRWTGRDLSVDSKKADQYSPAGFVVYYTERYKMACWQVHGSGVILTLENPPDFVPYMAAISLLDARRFSTESSKLLLQLVLGDKYDAGVDERFEQLMTDIATACEATLKLHEKSSGG